MTLQSAGTRSPLPSFIRSPGTRSFELLCPSFPSLITRAVGAASSFKACKAFSARNSCINPITEFMIRIISITIASVTSLIIIPEIKAAAINIQIMKSLNWEMNILKGLRPFFSSSSLKPDVFSLSSDSSTLRPLLVFVCSKDSISFISFVCQAVLFGSSNIIFILDPYNI